MAGASQETSGEVGMGAGSGALAGAATGAMVGSVVPGVGTLIGAGVGAGIGAGMGALGGMGQSKARKAQQAAIRAQQEAIRADQTRRAQGAGMARQTFGDVWSYANGQINAANALPQTGHYAEAQDPSRFQDLAKTVSRHGEIAGGIESQAAAVRDAGQANLTGTAQQAAVANRGAMAQRGLFGSSLADAGKQQLLAQYAGNRANVAGATEATRQGAWGDLRQRQAGFENLAQSGGNLSQQMAANASASNIAGARAQMPVAMFGNLLNSGMGILQTGAQAETGGGQGFQTLGLPSLGIGPASKNKATGAATSGGGAK